MLTDSHLEKITAQYMDMAHSASAKVAPKLQAGAMFFLSLALMCRGEDLRHKRLNQMRALDYANRAGDDMGAYSDTSIQVCLHPLLYTAQLNNSVHLNIQVVLQSTSRLAILIP